MNKSKTIGAIVVVAVIILALYYFVGPKESALTQPEITNQPTAEQISQTSGTYQLDTEESVIRWEGQKTFAGGHHGNVKFESGEVTLENGVPTSGSFVVDMTSLQDEDVQNEAMRAQLEGHLKSDDFFGVEAHPTANFVVTSTTQSEDDPAVYAIEGDMTIKGITNSISFPITLGINDEQKITAFAQFDLDRTRWDVRFGSDKFFDNLGDGVIDDNFTVQLNIVAQ